MMLNKFLIEQTLEKAKVVILSRDQAIRVLLQNAGFKHINVIKTDIDRVRNLVAESQCDILMIEDEFDGEITTPMIYDIRHSRLGKNPFLPIIVMTQNGNATIINHKIKAGADDVIVKPLSPEFVGSRVKKLVLRDVEYVVTHEYIGPNRRPKDRTVPEKDGIIEIPNTLRYSAEDKTLINGEVRRAINEANKIINEQRVSRIGKHISGLLSSHKLSEVETALSEFSTRLQATDLYHVQKLCKMLISVISITDGFSDDEKKIELLKLMAHALDYSFDDEYSYQALEIVKLVEEKFEDLK